VKRADVQLTRDVSTLCDALSEAAQLARRTGVQPRRHPMPRYLSLYTPRVAPSGPPSPEHMAEMGQLIEKFAARNALVMAGGVLKGALKVSRDHGDLKVTEVARTPEHGFAILDANDKDDLIGMIGEFLAVAGDGECEIHPLMSGLPPGA
jgi:hypothetical protein